MKLPPFEYASPGTLQEATALLAKHNGEARPIAGGQSLLPLMAYRLAAPSLLIDLAKIEGLNRIEIGEDGVQVGAMTRWCQIEAEETLTHAHPLMREAVRNIAHYQIRNRGTIGGSLAHADPAAEMPALAITCDAEIYVTGARGSRVVAAKNFVVAPLETSLKPDELITSIRFPRWQPHRRWAFLEFSKRRGDFALGGVALHFEEDAQGHATAVHVGVFGTGETPGRLAAVEDFVTGKKVDAALAHAAGRMARANVQAASDMHASEEYRKALIGTLLERALIEAATRRTEEWKSCKSA
ncbi:MAG TPA: xanthine dehydrogenase family protein subunit M [Xanthobacteraceae bacterium]|nr:xanthine dehydrogenase family protein subunit M [Xanthobacteraceae bacterium]